MSSTPTGLIPLVVPAVWALRRHWRSASVVALSLALGLSAALPARLTRALRYTTVRDAGWPLRGSELAVTPADTQRQAVAGLAGLVRGAS